MSDRSLSPVPFDGAEHLGFRCKGCGECCKRLRVVTTHLDLKRLSAATALPADELVMWLGPDEVDMEGEPETFVELSCGRRLMVLAERAGACRFLGADQRCTVYAARPEDCRLFPFDPELAADGGLVRLRLLPLAGCESDSRTTLAARELAQAHARRLRELEEYQSLVSHWNRRAKHRRRLGRRVGSADEFLAFLGCA